MPEPMSSQDDDAAFAAIIDDAASAAVELSSGIAMLATQKPEISRVESVGRSRPRCASTVLLLLAHLSALVLTKSRIRRNDHLREALTASLERVASGEFDEGSKVREPPVELSDAGACKLSR